MKSIISILIFAIVYVCNTNAVPIVESNKEVIPSKNGNGSDCNKKSINETMNVPTVDKFDKISKTNHPIEHVGHFFVEPIDGGKEAIIFPEYKHSENQPVNFAGTGADVRAGSPTSFAKKQAFLNDAKPISDDQDWNEDIRHDHFHPTFEHIHDHTNNYPQEELLHTKPGFTAWN